MKSKYLILGLTVFLFFFNGYSQNTTYTDSSKADSLLLLIEKHATDDEEKVRLVNEYARQCFYKLDIEKGLSATRDARLLSEKLNFEGGKIMYYLTLATFFGDGRMFDYYQKQAQWLSKSPDKQLDKYYVSLSRIEYDFGTNYEQLIKQHAVWLKQYEQLDDKEIQACILGNIAWCYYDLGNREELIRIEDKLINLYTQLGHPYPVFRFMSLKMADLKRLGRHDEAKTIETDLIESISKNLDSNVIGLITLSMGTGYSGSGRNALAIEYYLKSIPAFERTGDMDKLAETYLQMGRAYDIMEMFDKSVDAYTEFISILKRGNDEKALFDAYNRIAMALFHSKRYEDARKYMALALQDTSAKNKILFQGRKYSLEGQILKDSLQFAEAIPYFQNANKNYIKVNQTSSQPFMSLYIAECYYHMKDYNTALEYALKSLNEEYEINNARTKVKRDLSLLLSEIYNAKGQQQKAYEYLKMYQKIRAESDRLDEANRIADTEVRIILEKSQKEIDLLEQQKAQKEQESKIQRLWIFSIVGALISLIILSLVLYRNNKNKQKANELLNKQKAEIETQKQIVEDALTNLKSTQSQLIQSEKMASLGELTAGIAHEIQNPLNFVNNFSEVNKELISEMREEIVKKNFDEVEFIAKDLEENEQKINHHGKRAEGIVKGMLQHSRTSTEQKELTDINVLADEYLRLAYHGLRAKDKSFNADFKMEADGNLPKINVIPQDVGRVLLNLINNAFYAVSQRAKHAPENYHALVIVKTNVIDKQLNISVQDNGSGIPDEMKDKIFQPFFTTKPSGQGTGLGLSLSYDIVKAHGGTIIVETNENIGTEFTITLPTNKI